MVRNLHRRELCSSERRRILRRKTYIEKTVRVWSIDKLIPSFSFWGDLMEQEIFQISIKTFEVGVLLSILWDHPCRQQLMGIINQLRDIGEQIQRKAGVKIEKLPDGRLKLTDREGNVIIRPPYGWEEPNKTQ